MGGKTQFSTGMTTLMWIADMSDKELPARLAIESQYARLSEAVRNKDLDALRALHTSEYRELQITGEERDLAEVMAEWRGDLAAVIEPSFQTEIHNFDLDGDVANVTVSSASFYQLAIRFTAVQQSDRDNSTRFLDQHRCRLASEPLGKTSDQVVDRR